MNRLSCLLVAVVLGLSVCAYATWLTLASASGSFGGLLMPLLLGLVAGAASTAGEVFWERRFRAIDCSRNSIGLLVAALAGLVLGLRSVDAADKPGAAWLGAGFVFGIAIVRALTAVKGSARRT